MSREWDRDEVQAARTTVRTELGSAMADKASDEFCVATVRRRRAFGLEARPAPGRAAPAATVVEFRPAGPAPRLRPPVAEDADWRRLAEELKRLSAEAYGVEPLRMPVALRQQLVQHVRVTSYQTMAPVYDEIERLSTSPLGISPEVLGSPQVPTLVTQVCWLNRTLRTWVGPEALADAVADPAVDTIDVPRRLSADAHTPNHVAIGFPPFHQDTKLTGKGITVAVIDSEVALHHPGLRGRVVHRRNYTPEPWGNPDGHGTAVAGIIAGDDETFGGLAPEAVIYNYKVLATSHFLNGDDFAGVLAVQQALEDGVDIANCSWGAGPVGERPSRDARAVTEAWNLGLTVVKSAGNRGPRGSTMTIPADADGVIVVGGTGVDGIGVQDYSSRGPGAGKPGPDVVAPGGSEDTFISCCLPQGGFGNAGAGTSFAAPHVTGLIALFLQQDPGLLPDQLRERLRAGARRLDGFGAEAQGAGLIRAG